MDVELKGMMLYSSHTEDLMQALESALLPSAIHLPHKMTIFKFIYVSHPIPVLGTIILKWTKACRKGGAGVTMVPPFLLSPKMFNTHGVNVFVSSSWNQ